MEIFGFTFGSKAKEEKSELKSIALPVNDGSAVVTQNGSDVVGGSYSWTTSVDVDPLIVSESQLITRYREMSYVGEIDKAIDIIVNEMISTSANPVVNMDLTDVEYSDALKDKIQEEFDYIIKLLDFNKSAYDIVRRFYIDGRLQYQVVVDKEKYQQQGIGKLVYLDPRKLKKVKVVNADKDRRTGAELYSEKGTYYLYSEHGLQSNVSATGSSFDSGAISISDDAVVQITSGLLDPTNSVVLSYLHKAIRPLNQLKGLEDATMIYKLSRAPERRIFYIDVGNLPPAKAEETLRKQMNQYRSKMVYDVHTGAVRSDPKQMTMIEDYWLPRRSDGRATEITTLPSGNLSGEMGELQWFLNKLYNSLNVPITRMETQNGFSLGKTTEITRDEVALTKFIYRLRNRFSNLFLDLLKRQLTLKGILSDTEFDDIKDNIKFVYESDNHFHEMLTLEVIESKLNVLDRIVNYAPGGQYTTLFSTEYIYKNILFLTDEEVEEMRRQIKSEMKEYDTSAEEDSDGEATEGRGGPNVTQVVHNKDNSPTPNVAKSEKTTETINTSNNEEQ